MYWLFLLLSLGCFTFAIKTPSTGMMMLWLAGALVFLLAWIRGRYLASFGGSQRDAAGSHDIYNAIDPAELRRLREQAQARRDVDRDPNDLPPSL